MNRFLDWRRGVMAVAFIAGCLAVAMAFGDDDRPLGEWMAMRLMLEAVAAGCFYAVYRLAKKLDADCQ